jgi:hypothetical protein
MTQKVIALYYYVIVYIKIIYHYVIFKAFQVIWKMNKLAKN